jgi:hypothetical protein
VFGINKRKAHVPLRSFTSQDQAFQHYRLASEVPTTPRQLMLSGDHWKFRLFGRPAEVTDGFWSLDFDASEWDEVRNAFQTRLPPPFLAAPRRRAAAARAAQLAAPLPLRR